MLESLKGPHLRLFAGAVLISLSPVWVKLVSVPPTTSGFYRVAIGSITLIVLMIAARRRLRLSPVAYGRYSSSAACSSRWISSSGIVRIIYIGPGLATLLANFQVFIMMIAGFVLLKQRPTGAQLDRSATGADWARA